MLFLHQSGADLHLFQTRFVIGWENNRDGDKTMPLSLKTIGSAGYRRILADVIVYIFSSLAYDLTHRGRGRIYELNAKLERAD